MNTFLEEFIHINEIFCFWKEYTLLICKDGQFIINPLKLKSQSTYTSSSQFIAWLPSFDSINNLPNIKDLRISYLPDKIPNSLFQGYAFIQMTCKEIINKVLNNDKLKNSNINYKFNYEYQPVMIIINYNINSISKSCNICFKLYLLIFFQRL